MDTDASLLQAGARFGSAARKFASRGDDEEITAGLAEVLTLLAEQREWRVLIDCARNLGHQGSSVMLLRRLIDLTGFNGRAVIVYVDHQREILGRTAEKLALMFPGVDPARLSEARASYGPCTDIRFLPFERRSELTEPIAFGFTGGADDLAVNFALELNVRFFVRLQPYLWEDPPAASGDAYYETSRVEQPDGRHLYLTEFYPEIRELTLELLSSPPTSVDPAVWSWYLETQTFDPHLARRVGNARAVLKARGHRTNASGRPIRLWPIYGLQHFRETAAELFLACTFVALRYAATKGVCAVLCSFSPGEELADWADLAEALADDLAARRLDAPSLAAAIARRYGGEGFDYWAQAAGSGILAEASGSEIRIHRSFASDSRQWLDVAAQLETGIVSDERAGVHLAELGTMPMDVFQLFVSNGDMPSVIEGQASANMLAVLGRPFLQILRKEHVIKNGYAEPLDDPDLGETAKRIAGMCVTLREMVPALMDPAAYCNGIDEIVSFMCEAEEESSPVGRYFEAIRARSAQRSQNKLLVTLLALREVILAAA